MHIKNIIISGFRSYREQSFEEDLSPKHNVIVGKNGSGKSNFFAAVQFVLSEKFADLRANERKDLFHVGSGRPALSVFVEIVFDNSDGRIVIPGRPEEPEVRIRRTLGLKQDEFRVNDRKYSSAEVRQLLVSAGFSASNPYYIVEQGKIVNLANMTEADRYQLLKDVAGTNVYEARREESAKILADTALKHQQIDEAIGQLDARLKELEAESSELKAFQDADRARKSIEYCIFSAELASAKGQLEKVDSQWEARLQAAERARDGDAALREEVASLDAQVERAKKRAAELDAERAAVEKERTALLARRAALDLQAKDAASASTRDEEEQRALRREEKELEGALAKTEANLAAKSKAHKAAAQASEALGEKLAAEESRLEVLQAKRGRRTQFKSKGERDAWLRAEIKRNEELLKGNDDEIANFKKETKRLADTLAREQQSATEQSKSAKQQEAAMGEQLKRRDAALERRDELNGRRRAMWQAIHEQERLVAGANEELLRAQGRFERSTRNDIRQGHQSLLETLREINDPKLTRGVFGQVIELMEVEPQFRTAVEITAGNALFNIVVDSFATSARLLEHINKRRKQGRVTFFPLDTLKPAPRALPTTAECSPLLSHVVFDKKFAPVYNELFGKTAVVKTLETAVTVARDLDCDVVTLDGDQLSRKGGITGGYVEKANMKIPAYLATIAAAKELQTHKDKLAAMCQEVAAVEQQITAAVQDIERINSQDAALRSDADGERHAMRFVEEIGARVEQQLAHIAESIANLTKANAAIRLTNAALEKEFATDFKEAMTADEERELDRLQASVGTLRTEHAAAVKLRTTSATDVQLLEDTKQHMMRRLGNVRDRLEQLARAAQAKPLGAHTKEIASLDAELRVLAERAKQAEAKADQELAARQKLDEKADAARRRLLTSARQHQEEKESIDVAHNQRALLVQKKEDAQAKMRRLGVVPADADKYAAHSMGKLMHLLKEANETLKAYAHVNKKALDQYNALAESRTELAQRRDALNGELRSIEKLLTHLDQQKGEAILRTYKQVQFHFEEVFKELVAAEGCTADLQLVKSTDKKAADPFTEVRVCVSFGLGSAVAELGQLSGGQKSLVALALIFAIQRCDPAPFYLFDEIDAALDAEYRTSVARMLQKQSASCQFLTASFKTEMLEAADRVYGIFFHNKVSRVQQISKEEGVALLMQAAQDEKKRKRDDE